MSNKVNGVCVDERGHAYLVADGWESKEGRRPLYTTDHAEELAKWLELIITEGLDEHYADIDPNDYICEAKDALFNYREATK